MWHTRIEHSAQSAQGYFDFVTGGSIICATGHQVFQLHNPGTGNPAVGVRFFFLTILSVSYGVHRRCLFHLLHGKQATGVSITRLVSSAVS